MADVLERVRPWRIEHPNVAWEPGESIRRFLDGGRPKESLKPLKTLNPPLLNALNRPPSNEIFTDRLHPGHNGLGIKLWFAPIYDTVPELPAQSCERHSGMG